MYFLCKYFFALLAFSSAHAQQDVPAQDFTAPASPQSVDQDKFETLSRTQIASPRISDIPDIPPPKLPAFAPIDNPKDYTFPHIPDPVIKFSKFGEEEPQVTEIQSVPSLPPLKVAEPTAQFVPDAAGGGKTTPQNVSSTPVPSPQQRYSWGQSSTPISSPLPQAILIPNRQSPYVWGQSSTPISSPLPLQPLTPNQQTPYSWGRSSTPIAGYQHFNTIAPYVWGRSSTPTATSFAAPNLGRSSTPQGPSSTPRGISSSPQGGSSTPHGLSSTPQGPSSTPRAR